MSEMNQIPEGNENNQLMEGNNRAIESVDNGESLKETAASNLPKIKLSIISAIAGVAAITIAVIVACSSHSHVFSKWYNEKDATCTENGEKVRYCDCGEKESEIIPASHKLEIIPAVEPTCTEVGYTQGSNCSACNTVIENPSVVEPKHKFINCVCDLCGEINLYADNALIMEAEYINLDGVPGMGVYVENPGLCMIYGDGRDDQKELWSNGYYVGYTHNDEIVLEFVFNSSKDSTATLMFALGCEIKDTVFVSGKNLGISVNGQEKSFNWAVTCSEMSSAEFVNYTLKDVQLKKGENKIIISVLSASNEPVRGPLIDCITVLATDGTKLSWEPHDDNPERRDTEDYWW